MADYTLASITEEIASSLGKELDEPFKRLLADKVRAWRSTLLRRTLKENPSERMYFRQTIYVKLVKTSPVPDCLDPIAPVCDVMRSELPLPSPVRAGSIGFDYVGSVDGNNAFRRAAPGSASLLSAGKYSKHLVTYDEINDYLEVYNATGLPLARVDGVFDDPEEVALFNCQSTGDCDFWNSKYPVSGDIKQAIVECILKVDYQQGVTPANKEVEVTPQKQEHAPDGR